jgi:hypothetical protein
VEVPGDVAEELLQAADQYMLEGLKRLCEVAIARTLSVDSLPAAQEVCPLLHTACAMCRTRLTFAAVDLSHALLLHCLHAAVPSIVHQRMLLLSG